MKIKRFLCAVALWLGLSLPAAALPITVMGTTYDVRVETTTYTASTALLQAQPWWGDATLALNLATTLGNSNNIGVGSFVGFAYEVCCMGGGVTIAGVDGGGGINGASGQGIFSVVNYVVLEVPEIDGMVLWQALFVLGVGYVLMRRRRIGGTPGGGGPL